MLEVRPVPLLVPEVADPNEAIGEDMEEAPVSSPVEGAPEELLQAYAWSMGSHLSLIFNVFPYRSRFVLTVHS